MPPDNFPAYPDGFFDYLAKVAIRFAMTFGGKALQELGSPSLPFSSIKWCLNQAPGIFRCRCILVTSDLCATLCMIDTTPAL